MHDRRQIGEIYSLARDSLLGRPSLQVQAIRSAWPADLWHRTHPQLAFWQMLKIGNDHFEAHLEPRSMCVIATMYSMRNLRRIRRFRSCSVYR
jgi:murein L,D-transpeptidase YafK